MSPHDRGASAQRVAARYKQKKKVKTKDGDESTVYVYSEGQLAHRHREKAKRIEGLRSCVGELRTQVHRDLTAKDPKKRLTALAVSLIDKTCERVGNEGSAEEGHYGVTGWLKKHLTFKGGTAVLRYVGKSGVKHVKEVDHAATVKALRDAAEGKGAEDPLFDDGEVCVRASDVNEYLKPFDVTAKDIRGFRANTEMLRALKAQRAEGPEELPRDRAERDKILKGEFKAALEEVAEIVGHEASTLRSQYLVPALEDTFMGDGTVIKELDAKKTAAAPRVRPGARVHVPGYGAVVEWFGDPPARLATKTPAEREDEAVRKNVRQSPKKKPPRKDLRKRRVEEADPDMDTSAEERDYSLNYKRVAARWVRAEGGFREYVESRRFKNPETGNEVSYDSLPEEAQVEIRDQWEGKNLPGDEAKEPEAPGSEDAPSSGGGGEEGAGVRAELRSLAQGGDSLRPETAREIGDLFERVVAVLTLEAGEELAQGVRKDMERVADRAARASGFAAQVQELLARGDGESLPPPGDARAAYEKALARVSRMDPGDPKASSARDALIEAARDFYRTAVARDYITRPELGEPAPEGGDEQSLKAWAAARARDRYEALPAGYREERLAAVASELDQVRAELAREGAGGVSSARLERKRAVLEADWEEGRIMSLLEEKKSPPSSEDGDGEPDPEVFASQLVRSLHGRVGRGDKHLRALVHGPDHPQYAAAVHNLTNLLSDAELKKFLGPEAGALLDAMSKGSEEDGGGPASREERQELRRALINGRVNGLGGTAPADPPPPARGGSEAEWRKRMKAWLAARMEALAERLAEPFEGPAPGDVTSIMRVASRALRSGAYRPW